ncbi:MAG TPA: flagellar export chaperone FliS [Syntrophorhabdaceae bacterium]|nr:flagellar export chaperone FliS [Syntrophorhabdaceae bacterium]
MSINGIASYKNTATSVDEYDKGLLLIKVFQKILEKFEIAKIHIESKNFEKRYEELSKVRQVIELLHDSVDVQYGEISHNLQNLYIYIIKRLNEANINNDKKAIEECKSLIQTIYEGFEEAYRKEKANCLEDKNGVKSNDCHVEIGNQKAASSRFSNRAYAVGSYL